MPFTLRPYQQEAVRAVQRDWAAGHKAVLGTAAVGAGKTQIFLALLLDEIAKQAAAGRKARALIISHREELVFQPIERLYQCYPEWKGKAGAVMGAYDERDRQIVSATVQTLASGSRLEKVLWHGAFDYVVVDEAHHMAADTYVKVYEQLKAANPNLLALGVTATPIRADGKGLRVVFSHESFHYDIRTMIKAGWLVPPRWLAIQTGISIAEVQIKAGDFVGSQLADVFETQNCFELVAKSHRDYADGRQAIAFTESVDGAYRLAEAFNKAGIRAEAADGTTKKDARRGLLERYRAGEVQVLVNCALFTEGIDLPQTSCLHMVRPTRSDGAYIQMVGRGLRLAPGKEDALILDYCPAESRNICMLGDVLGVEAKKEVYLDEDGKPGDVVGGFTFDGKDVKWLKGDPYEIISRELDYLELSPYSWHHADDHWLTLGLGEFENLERTLAISAPDAEGLCCLWVVSKDRANRTDGAAIALRGTFEEVSDKAEALIGQYGNAILTGKQKAWRKQPASDAQRQFAQKLGVWTDGMSKGQCAEAITHKLAVRTIGRFRGRAVYVQPALPATVSAA